MTQLRNAVLAVAALAACSTRPPETVVYTSVDQIFSEPVLRAFEKQSGLAARAVFDTEETKSTGVLNRLIAVAARPQADVFWSGDPVRPFLLIKRGLVWRRTDLPLKNEGRTYGKKAEVPAGAWSELKVAAKGNLFEVHLNGQKLYEVEDATFPEAGKVGVWTKADSVTRFDNLNVAAR